MSTDKRMMVPLGFKTFKNGALLDNITKNSSSLVFGVGKYNVGGYNTDSNGSYFNTSKMLVTTSASIEFENIGNYLVELVKFNSDGYAETRTQVSTQPIELTEGTYSLQGYTQPSVTRINSDILKQLALDITLDLGHEADAVSSGVELSSIFSIPNVVDNKQTLARERINTIKYPLMPVWGHEFLTHWYERIYDNLSAVTVGLDGDSITAGYASEYTGVSDAFTDMRGWAIQKIMAVGNFTSSNLTIFNNGQGGRNSNEWVGNATYGLPTEIALYPNGYLDTMMDENPDLLLIAWGMNDADRDHTPFAGLTLQERIDLFVRNMSEGLRRIRGSVNINGRPSYSKTVNDLSIIICMPTVGGAESTGRGNVLWNQYLRQSLMEMCREYECAFADMTSRTYSHNDFQTRYWSTLTSSGSYGGIHPNKYSSAQTMSMLQDLIYPICMWDVTI